MFRRLKRLVRGEPPKSRPAAPARRPPARPEPTVPAGPPSPDEPHVLALYKYDACPFCRRVMVALEELPGVQVEMRDTRMDPAHRKALAEKTGRTTVPCLYIDDYALFESLDIIEWLEAYAEGGAKALAGG